MRRVESLRVLSSAWDGLARAWLEALSAISCALELAEQFWWRPADASPGARTRLLLAVAGSARRTATTPDEDVRLESALTFTWRALGQLVCTGEADADAVAEALLEVERGAPASPYPWSAVLFASLGSAATSIALAMRQQLRGRTPHSGWAGLADPRFRLRAEIG